MDVLDVKVPPNVAKIFKEIVRGEPWADRISYEVDERWTSNHLVYKPDSRRGCVRFPPHPDVLVIASWIAHEGGHFDYYEHNSPKKIRIFIEWVIRSERIPSFVSIILRQLYTLFFWSARMRREIYAHEVEIKLLKKAGYSLKAVERGDQASDELIPFKPRLALVERLFQHQMQKTQNRLTLAALSIKT